MLPATKLPEVHDLHEHIGSVKKVMDVSKAIAVLQTRPAVEDLVTGLAGDAELGAQRRHLLALDLADDPPLGPPERPDAGLRHPDEAEACLELARPHSARDSHCGVTCSAHDDT